MKKIQHILLFLMLALTPVVALARKKSKVTEPVGPVHQVLTNDEQQRFDSLYFTAISLQFQGKAGDVMPVLREALAVDSTSAPAQYMKGCLLAENRQYGEALESLQRAVALDSANFWYNSALGDILATLRQYKEAIRPYERLHRLYPEKSEPCYSLMRLYAQVDSFPRCLEMLDCIEEIDGVNPQLIEHKFMILSYLEREDEAFGEFDKLISRYPYEMDYRLQKAEMQMNKGRLEEAKKTLDEASVVDPDNAYLWLALSNYYSIMGQQEESDDMVNRALINPNLDIDTKTGILTEYLKTLLRKVSKEKQEAQDTTQIELPGVDELFQKVEMMHPTAPEVYALHADYLSAISQDSLASEQMHFATSLRPTDGAYWTRYLVSLIRSEQAARVKQVAEEARAAVPDLVEAYTIPAIIYIQEEKSDSAIWCYRQAIASVSPAKVADLSIIWGSLADELHKIGEKAESYECYEKAVKLNEKNYVALNNYAYFLSIEGGDLKKAERMAAKVIQQYPDNPTYLDTYAWILYLQGDYQLAKFYQQKAIEKAGDEATEDLQEHYKAILEKLEQ